MSWGDGVPQTVEQECGHLHALGTWDTCKSCRDFNAEIERAVSKKAQDEAMKSLSKENERLKEDVEVWKDAFLATQDCRQSEEEKPGDAVRRIINENTLLKKRVTELCLDQLSDISREIERERELKDRLEEVMYDRDLLRYEIDYLNALHDEDVMEDGPDFG